MNKNNIVFNWNDYDLKKKEVSVTKLLERHDRKVKEDYISLIHNIGNKTISSNNLKNYFLINKNISLWSASILFEKNIYKSNNILDCLKIIALRNHIKENRIKKIKIINLPKICLNPIRNLKKKYKIKIDISLDSQRKALNLKPFIKLITPYLIQSLYTLSKYYFISQSNYKNVKTKKKKNKEIAIVSYFLNYDDDKLKKGSFVSDYWRGLDKIIKSLGYKLNWIHIFAEENINYRKHRPYFENINNKAKNESHYFLNEEFTLKVFIKSLINYFKIFFKTFLIKDHKLLINDSVHGLFLYELLKDDYLNSIRGPNLMRNITIFHLFNNKIKKMNKGTNILYSHEGQGWEKPFVSNVRDNLNSKVIGVIQSPIRFWDIKLFDKNINYKSLRNYYFPPDLLAVNTYNGTKMLKNSGIKSKYLVEVEPLRFKKIFTKVTKKRNYKRKIFKALILGSFQSGVTQDLLIDLENIDVNIKYTFRPHPGNRDLNVSFFTDIKSSLNKLLNEADIVIVSNDSSVAVDAYLANKFVIVYLGKGKTNLSPLRNFKFVKFCSNNSDLRISINEFIKLLEKNKNFNKYIEDTIYYKNIDFKKWKQLIRKL